MSQHTFWWPGRKSEQVLWLSNCLAAWPSVGPTLGYSPAQVSEFSLLLMEFLSVIREVDQSQIAMKALNEWRDQVLYGDETNMSVNAAPMIVSPATPTINGGFFNQLKRWRMQIMALPQYSTAVGDALGLIGAEKSRLTPDLIVPQFKISSSTDFWVNFVGSMQGFAAVNVDYLRNGYEDWETMGYLTRTPGKLQFRPAIPNTPETGVIRCSFVSNNQRIGNYSPSYAVTIS